jgi:hypothetical protein
MLAIAKSFHAISLSAHSIASLSFGNNSAHSGCMAVLFTEDSPKSLIFLTLPWVSPSPSLED